MQKIFKISKAKRKKIKKVKDLEGKIKIFINQKKI